MLTSVAFTFRERIMRYVSISPKPTPAHSKIFESAIRSPTFPIGPTSATSASASSPSAPSPPAAFYNHSINKVFHTYLLSRALHLIDVSLEVFSYLAVVMNLFQLQEVFNLETSWTLMFQQVWNLFQFLERLLRVMQDQSLECLLQVSEQIRPLWRLGPFQECLQVIVLLYVSTTNS